MKKIGVINAIAKSEGIKKADKIIAIEYLSNPETKFLDGWKEYEIVPDALDEMFLWKETPQKKDFWREIHDTLELDEGSF